MNNWFITEYEQIQLEDGFTISLSTNVPVHLWLYWSTEEPWVHRVSGDRRGVLHMWFSYFCFVAWNKVEQNEAGDTLTHTFDLHDWPFCETRWFVIAGEVGLEKSPSVSPIFKKHNEHRAHPPIQKLARRRIYTLGAIWTISELNQIAQICTTGLRIWTLHNIVFYMEHHPDELVIVSIHNVDAEDKPTGPSLAHKAVNLKDGILYCAPVVYQNSAAIELTIPPNTKFAIVIRGLADVGHLWKNFPYYFWTCPHDWYDQFTRGAFRSNDGGVTWHSTTVGFCFESWGYLTIP